MNGPTRSNLEGKYTFGIRSSSGRSVIDHFTASANCMSATQSLQVFVDVSHYMSDHNSLLLHLHATHWISTILPLHPTAQMSATSGMIRGLMHFSSA